MGRTTSFDSQGWGFTFIKYLVIGNRNTQWTNPSQLQHRPVFNLMRKSVWNEAWAIIWRIIVQRGTRKCRRHWRPKDQSPGEHVTGVWVSILELTHQGPTEYYFLKLRASMSKINTNRLSHKAYSIHERRCVLMTQVLDVNLIAYWGAPWPLCQGTMSSGEAEWVRALMTCWWLPGTFGPTRQV